MRILQPSCKAKPLLELISSRALNWVKKSVVINPVILEKIYLFLVAKLIEWVLDFFWVCDVAIDVLFSGKPLVISKHPVHAIDLRSNCVTCPFLFKILQDIYLLDLRFLILFRPFVDIDETCNPVVLVFVGHV